MFARDLYHDAVKNALVKDDWTVTHDPLRMQLGNPGANVYVDLAAERILVAERENQKIAVKVKSFLGMSFMADLHNAVGQFIVYLSVLEEIEPERVCIWLCLEKPMNSSGENPSLE